MYKEIHIEYSSLNGSVEPITLKYKIRNTNIAQKWASKVATCIENYNIDQPNRFYGFDDYTAEKTKAIEAINRCCDIIDEYSPIIKRRVDQNVDQDTLNFLHHIFEVYHGLLGQPHDFYIGAPEYVQKALAQLNIEVHRCESFVEGLGRRIMPRHIVTWFGMNRNDKLEAEDYNHFTDYYEPGTIYLLYVEIGKTLEDLATDNDQYIGEDAYKPFVHYTADFVVRFFGTSKETWKANRIKMKEYYEKNKDFFDSKGLPLSHPHNRPGNIPVADLLSKHFDPYTELRKRQCVSKVTII
jgi:hypothetical protein